MEAADVIIVGGGLAGLVVAHELTLRGKSVLILDQEGENSLGGQAFWSLGGLCLIDTPEQRRMRIRDSHALARQDWMGSAQFDREEDHWPRQWAEKYLELQVVRCGPGFLDWECAGSRLSVGQSGEVRLLMGTETRSPDFTLPGVPVQASLNRLSSVLWNPGIREN